MQYADTTATQVAELVLNGQASRAAPRTSAFAALDRAGFEQVLETVRQRPGYAPTPLVHLRGAAAMLGVGDIL